MPQPPKKPPPSWLRRNATTAQPWLAQPGLAEEVEPAVVDEVELQTVPEEQESAGATGQPTEEEEERPLPSRRHFHPWRSSIDYQQAWWKYPP